MLARIQRYRLTERRRRKTMPVNRQARARRIARENQRHGRYSFAERCPPGGNLSAELVAPIQRQVVGSLVVDEGFHEKALLLFAISKMEPEARRFLDRNGVAQAGGGGRPVFRLLGSLRVGEEP